MKYLKQHDLAYTMYVCHKILGTAVYMHFWGFFSLVAKDVAKAFMWNYSPKGCYGLFKKIKWSEIVKKAWFSVHNVRMYVSKYVWHKILGTAVYTYFWGVFPLAKKDVTKAFFMCFLFYKRSFLAFSKNKMKWNI